MKIGKLLFDKNWRIDVHCQIGLKNANFKLSTLLYLRLNALLYKRLYDESFFHQMRFDLATLTINENR